VPSSLWWPSCRGVSSRLAAHDGIGAKLNRVVSSGAAQVAALKTDVIVEARTGRQSGLPAARTGHVASSAEGRQARLLLRGDVPAPRGKGLADAGARRP